MVNKAAVGVLGVIVVVSLGVGTLIGMQIGGTADAPAAGPDQPSANGGSPDSDASSDGGTPTADGTAGTDATPTEQRTTIPARQFEESKIAGYVATYVNDYREEHGRQRLSTSDNTVEKVAAMARNHSVAMANAGRVDHEIDGVDTSRRYGKADLQDRCKFKAPDASYVRYPDSDFESIGSTAAGQHYQDGDETRFNGNESAVARAVVDEWIDSPAYRERLLINGPSRLGVGVEVASGGTAYVTANVCA